jgi:16S rRNA (guanine527-N7)-methyltransferase
LLSETRRNAGTVMKTVTEQTQPRTRAPATCVLNPFQDAPADVTQQREYLHQNTDVSGDAATQIATRAARVGISVERGIVRKLDAYLQLLARWNRRINLTALNVDPPTDDSIDRLLIEPLVAASRIEPSDRVAIDAGSGGGSPALPMKIAAPALRLVLVESRGKKCAFLREAVRHLELPGVSVENCRVEDLAKRSEFQGVADLVTMRAVAASHELRGSICALLRPGGRLFWFGGRPDVHFPEGFRSAAPQIVATPPNDQLLIVTLA